MHVEERKDGGIEITTEKQEKVVVGRSTIAGETMVSLNREDFYLFISDQKRLAAPIGKGDAGWQIGNFNYNQVIPEEVKVIEEPNEIELFDKITAPLSILEGLDKQLLATIPDKETWKQAITEIFQEESSLQVLKQLLR